MVMYDRFIPVRSGMDLGAALSELTWGAAPRSSSYRRRGRILAFNGRSSSKEDGWTRSVGGGKATTLEAERVLDAPGMKDDAGINPVDWGAGSQLAVAMEGKVHSMTVGEIPICNYVIEPGVDHEWVGCVKWAPDGCHLAVGLKNSIQLWDTTRRGLARTLRDSLGSRVNSVSWNGNILSSGGSDGSLVIHDPRLKASAVGVHSAGGRVPGICGLSWSPSGDQLAAGCSDGRVCIWDARTWNPWTYRCADGGVRALAWCPFRHSLLATGGGGCIKFLSTRTETCASTLQTGSGPVLALVWSKSRRQLLSSSSSPAGAMAIWDYPSMSKTRNLIGHTNRALYLSQSPDGCMIASAAGGSDQTIRLWNAFPPMPKEAAAPRPFANSHHTHIR